MAFGDTGVLDNFNRADAADLGANYSRYFGDAAHTISTNRGCNAAGGWKGDYWDTATFGPDCEVFITDVTGVVFYLGARLSDAGTGNPHGYTIRLLADYIWIRRTDHGVSTQLGAEIAWTVAAGDKVGLECIDDQISAYVDDGGAGWTCKGTRTDATYADAGNIAFETSLASYWEDLGGGTIGAAADEVVVNNAIASTATVSTPSATIVFAPTVIATTATVPSPGGAPVLAPTAIASTATVNAPAGAPVLAPTFVASTATVPNAILTTYWAWPTTIGSTAVVFNPTVTQPGVGVWWKGATRRRRVLIDDDEWLLL